MCIMRVLLLISGWSLVTRVKTKIECGYKQCPPTREGTLNVHLIPHSHMDAGWVKTFDEYYHGTKASVSSANVQLIYHSVLSELLHDKRRKFTFSETAYFWRWWKEQRPATRTTFRSLVQEGRVEFAGGGWVQNDEATVTYGQIIDQYTWGLRKLNDTLGPCGKPKAGWQIDTYGHSREQASLLAQMGFDGLFIGRVDAKKREQMIDEDRLEFMWRGSDVLGKISDIMTHTLFNLYNPPEGFCFDFLCNDEPIVDDPDSMTVNADQRVSDFIAQIERQAKYYDHDNIMVMMGGDFTYQAAANWFMNIDKLINHVHTHQVNMSDINIFYSTPSCYLKAVYLYGRRDKAMSTMKSDFLPYGSDPSTYWTGYFTSRPSLKYFVRRAHHFLQVAKQVSVMSRAGDSFELHLLRHAVSLVLHHDGVTGTSQHHVASDFARLLSESIAACTKKVSTLLSYLTPTWGNSRRNKNNQQFIVCHELNVSQCRFLESQEVILLLLYNPSSVKTYHYVRIPAIALHYTIRDFNDDEVEYQLVPMPSAVINLPGRSSPVLQELYFEAESVPPLGYSAYYITTHRDQLEESKFKQKSSQPIAAEREDKSFITNEYLKVTVNKETGLLDSIQHIDDISVQVSQNFYYYSQSLQSSQQSGTYSFRPEKERPTPVTENVSYQVVTGPLIKEIRQKFNEWITQIIRLYRGEDFLEMEWIVGPVPISKDPGKEVVSVFATNISNNGEFYTDSNGRQMIKRTCWNDSTSRHKIPLPACYSPVTSRICLYCANSSMSMCILPDRTQGGTSYNQGEIELMVHRRLLTDDGFGLEETLNEEAYGTGIVVRGKHRVFIGNYRQEVDELSFSERMASASRRWQMEPAMFFTSGEKINRRRWQNVRNKRFSYLRPRGLPRHINILSLEPWKAGSVLLRLENILEEPITEMFDQPEDVAPKSSYITVDLQKIFQQRIRMVRETTLAANQWMDDARQMDWSTRYVYNGGDDGIQAEDAELDKEDNSRRVESKNDGYSAEDHSYSKIKTLQAGRVQRSHTRMTNAKQRIFYRRKRSLNDSYINKVNNTETNIDDDSKLLSTANMSIMHGSINISEKNRKVHTNHNIMSKSPSFLKIARNIQKPSSDEDFPIMLKKRSRRKLQKQTIQVSEIPTEDIDDGVTKSIYEMYYKFNKPATERIKHIPKVRISKKKARKYKQNIACEDTAFKIQGLKKSNRTKKRRLEKKIQLDYAEYDYTENPGEYSERTDEGYFEQMQMNEDGEDHNGGYVRKKRREVEEDYDYDIVNATNEDEDYDAVKGLRYKNRSKRALFKDEAAGDTASDIDQNNLDYIVTLRPTQIRTFIIWPAEQRNYVT